MAVPVKDSSGNTILTGANPLIIDIWDLGNEYYNNDPVANPEGQTMIFSNGTFLNSSRTAALVIPNSGGSGTGYANDWYFTRNKPQYETYSAADFINMKDHAAG